MRILGLVPARGGSKGIPGKNAKILSGKPLIQYTLEAAKAAESLTELIVSTDSDELMQLSRNLGVEAPFKRPDELASDTASSLAVVQHAVSYLQTLGREFDAVCLLQPTTPFRTASDIDSAVARFIDGGYDSLLSVREVPHQFHPDWVYLSSNDETISLATGTSTPKPQRQLLKKAYYRDGAIYITRITTLKKDSLYGDRIGYVVNDSQRFVNIDDWEDWQRAERILKEQ
ncbi:cytidylyltransferase domain-containing protein [Aureitalea marina]|uniref:Acylneuraminate cytidylyltransferase n=1 Tax=Aureitalea marina TaxID=930804 RepID=A0A2S7KMN0_9FLAO|nr:acylneuraminate cytidylyltransferase family protein [Aureitalea marina]PQB03889.1 acylneuraminate cytidylyltransferase [Aureitalea marina]